MRGSTVLHLKLFIKNVVCDRLWSQLTGVTSSDIVVFVDKCHL